MHASRASPPPTLPHSARPTGQQQHHDLEQRPRCAGGHSQGGGRVRARADLWPPAHQLQLRRRREEGVAAAAGWARRTEPPASITCGGWCTCWEQGCCSACSCRCNHPSQRAHAQNNGRPPRLRAQITGGRNGYGAKLANIFSTEFVIETCDGQRLKRYRQVGGVGGREGV